MRLSSDEAARRGRRGAYATLSKYDPVELTAKARSRGPGQIAYWIAKVDPDGTLPRAEAERRAKYAQRLHYARLGDASARARRARKLRAA